MGLNCLRGVALVARIDTIDRMVNLTVKTVGKRITYKELVA